MFFLSFLFFLVMVVVVVVMMAVVFFCNGFCDVLRLHVLVSVLDCAHITCF